MARRSVLFSPGDQPQLLRKAVTTDADVVVFDLEDAVVPTKKVAARNTVSTVLQEIDPDCELCVRINPLNAGGRDDLDAVLSAFTPDSIMLPKVTRAADIEELAGLLNERGADMPVLALLETAGGILDAPAVADADATDALLFGAEDLAAAIGASRTPAGTEILYARQRVVLAASRAGIDAIDTLVTDFENTERLQSDTARAVEFGFDGKIGIHPRQISVINDAFTPDEEQIEWARRVLEAHEESDHGVFSVDGEMIDAPLLAQAQNILDRAPKGGEHDTQNTGA